MANMAIVISDFNCACLVIYTVTESTATYFAEMCVHFMQNHNRMCT